MLRILKISLLNHKAYNSIHQVLQIQPLVLKILNIWKLFQVLRILNIWELSQVPKIHTSRINKLARLEIPPLSQNYNPISLELPILRVIHLVIGNTKIL